DRGPLVALRRPPWPAQIERLPRDGGEILERCLLLTPIQEIVLLGVQLSDASHEVTPLDVHEPFRTLERHAAQHRAVDDTEHRPRKSDAESQPHDRDGGDPEVLEKHAAT